MVDVARLGQANNRVDQDVSLPCSGGTHRQLAMSAVHRVPGLECDDSRPSKFLEVYT